MNQRASIKFIFITIVLEWLGVGIVIPILPDVIRRFNDNPSFVNHYFGYFVASYALMQFLASPVLGALSDRFGRRPILLSSLLGAGLDYILMAYAPTLSILFIGRVISGLTGAGMTVASSYIADVSNDSNRSANFGLMGAAFGLGFIIGPAIGGFFGQWGHDVPFLVAAALNLLNFAFGYFVLPESLPVDQRRNVSLKKLNPLSSILHVFRPSPILIFVVLYTLCYLAGSVHQSVWTLYTEYKFQWTPKEVGISLSWVGLVIAFAQGGLTRIIVPRFGEQKSLYFGFCVYIVSFFLFAIATEGWMMYVIMLIFAFSGITTPALQSLISRTVTSSEQGELQGSLIAIGSLTAIIGPIIYTNSFSQFTSPGTTMHFPGIPYAIASFISVVSLLVFAVSQRAKRP